MKILCDQNHVLFHNRVKARNHKSAPRHDAPLWIPPFIRSRYFQMPLLSECLKTYANDTMCKFHTKKQTTGRDRNVLLRCCVILDHFGCTAEFTLFVAYFTFSHPATSFLVFLSSIISDMSGGCVGEAQLLIICCFKTSVLQFITRQSTSKR